MNRDWKYGTESWKNTEKMQYRGMLLAIWIQL